MPNSRLPVFDKFIAELRAVWADDADDGRRMAKAKPLLEQLVKDPALEGAFGELAVDRGPQESAALCRSRPPFRHQRRGAVPGRTGSIHDHADAWVLYGVLDGTESLERFDRIDDGSRPGYAEVKLSSVTTGSQGKVDLVPPRAIHAEQGGPTRSVAVIVRSQKLGEGTVLQHRYDRDAEDRGRAIRADANSV